MLNVRLTKIVIIYDNNIVKIVNMMNYIVAILFTILSDVTTLLAMLLHYCYFITQLWTILRSVMAKAGDAHCTRVQIRNWMRNVTFMFSISLQILISVRNLTLEGLWSRDQHLTQTFQFDIANNMILLLCLVSELLKL